MHSSSALQVMEMSKSCHFLEIGRRGAKGVSRGGAPAAINGVQEKWRKTRWQMASRVSADLGSCRSAALSFKETRTSKNGLMRNLRACQVPFSSLLTRSALPAAWRLGGCSDYQVRYFHLCTGERCKEGVDDLGIELGAFALSNK